MESQRNILIIVQRTHILVLVSDLHTRYALQTALIGLKTGLFKNKIVE